MVVADIELIGLLRAVENGAEGAGDVLNGEGGGRDLVEKRLEEVVIGAINQGDVEIGAFVELTSAGEAAEATADDDDARKGGGHEEDGRRLAIAAGFLEGFDAGDDEPEADEEHGNHAGGGEIELEGSFQGSGDDASEGRDEAEEPEEGGEVHSHLLLVGIPSEERSGEDENAGKGGDEGGGAGHAAAEVSDQGEGDEDEAGGDSFLSDAHDEVRLRAGFISATGTVGPGGAEGAE